MFPAAEQPPPHEPPAREPPPAQARALFGSSLGLAERYADLLAGPAVQRGLIGPREAARLWERHIMNCAALAELVPHPSSVIDLGSGAGLPGIVIAILIPDATVVLLEPMARRAAFLEECVADLGLGNATVRRGRAEDLAGELAADVVVARAVAPMQRLAGLALGLVRPGGLVLALKGAGAEQELTRARPMLRRLGARDAAVVQAGSGRVSPPATVVRLTAGSAASRRRSLVPARTGARQGRAAGKARTPGTPGGAAT
ncbi:MAG TPA: 16S rRNA (guanine(527)-N(7))-methyltransferase RsmG [Streptosporangiaceae bacterium]|nr:16S rRNA (guanine(527)-N(7))-methyltransferase RsmG [Streptosporangiaceae bacterium]